MTITKPQKGNLLFAEPSIIGDSSFNRAVVLLTNHCDEGSIGFILNKPLKFTLQDFIPQLTTNFKVYNGGPVEQDNLYFIHKKPELIAGSIEITGGIYWGGNFETVITLINENKLNDSDITFFLGYSGWNFNQLEDELKTNSWIVSENIYKNGILKADIELMWKDKMIDLGANYSIWSNAPENPNYN
jgi:putative transcriptional regulator